MTRVSAGLVGAWLLLTACGGGPTATSSSAGSTFSAEDRFPDIVAATLTPDGDGGFDVEVTLTSPYDSPERYADGWRVLAPDGTVLGEHELTHDHADEQPVTRSQSGLAVPDGVAEVVVEGRDSENGYGGQTVTAPVP